MMTQCAPNHIIIGTILIVAGIPIYLKFAPKTEIKTVKKDIKLGEDFFSKQVQTDRIYLANFLRQIRNLIKKI
jgi:hypothetical protein